MKILKIVVTLMLFGLSQAGATGFTYNMFAAQRMLKAKKEAPALLKSVRPARSIPRDIHAAPPRRVALTMEQRVLEDEDDLQEKVVTTFSQLVSNFLIRILSLGVSR